MAYMVKNVPAMKETQVQSLGQEDPLEKEMATHSSILAHLMIFNSQLSLVFPLFQITCQSLPTDTHQNHHSQMVKPMRLLYKEMHPSRTKEFL